MLKKEIQFPISRDPPEGGTHSRITQARGRVWVFPISRDPPEGGTPLQPRPQHGSPHTQFPISRDPPEGGTAVQACVASQKHEVFPISRDPPEGGTLLLQNCVRHNVPNAVSNF